MSKKTVSSFPKFGIVMAFAFVLFLSCPKTTLATNYYISLSASDSNSGSNSSPFKTISKGVSVLKAGDNLFLNAGTYNEQMKVTISATSSAPINIQPVNGAKVILDRNSSGDNIVWLTGSYITVSDLEIQNSSGYCVNVQGTQNTFKNSLVHHCQGMGIYTDGKFENILGNTVHHASLVNSGFTMSSGWGSGIKVRVGGDNILIEGNTVYNNYGEGIAVTRGSNITVRKNITYDNYTTNIYIDNSYDILVDKNFSFNNVNNGFYRNGIPADNIAIGEENYSGWGAQLDRITIVNNIGYFGNHGVNFYGNYSGSPNGGLKNSVIAFNTFYNSVNNAISFNFDTGQINNLITNNIVSQSSGKLIYLVDPVGFTVNHNFWVGTVMPATYGRGAGDKSGDPLLSGTPGTTASAFALKANSPAIDGGVNVSGVTTDFLNDTRPKGAGYDMGAYEYGISVTPAPVLGDINGDGHIDILDYTLLSNAFGTNDRSSDLNNDGVVNILDYVILSSNFGG